MKSSNRRTLTILTTMLLLALGTLGFATTWQNQFAGVLETKVSAAEKPHKVETAPLVPLVSGTCDLGGPANAIEIESSGGTALAGYTTLTAGFAAINAGTHTGTITIDVCDNTSEGTGTAILNASGAGAASYASIVMAPAGGGARTITGATTAGAPMIDFNGADNVTINGLNTGGNSLTIANTTASATSGTATIRFIGGATTNTITNSSIQGSNSASVATNGGIIFFSTDAVTTAGNDNNTISNNNIGPAGANLPSKAILCNGSTATQAIGNSGLVIDNNNIFDYFGAAVTSAGVAVNGGCNTFSITNNRFYQTGTRTWTTGALNSAINLSSSTSISGVQGMTVTGNIIGYASNTQTGVYTLTGAGTGAKFVGIIHNGISTGTTSNVNNNTVAAVSMTGVTSSGTSTSSPFTGILLTEGNLISNGNTIGSQSAAGSLTFSTTTTSSTDTYGIFNFSSNVWTTNTNNIGGISVTNLGASGTFLVFGMRANTGAVAWNATSNNIGGTVANSIQLTGTGTSSQVVGMQTPNALANFTSNTIRNLTTNIGTGTTTGASVIGIVPTGTVNHTLSQNTIFNLSNTNTTAASVVTGIQFTGSTANVVERNYIYGLTVASNSATAEVNGIRVGGGTTIYRNNMIAIGAGIANAIGGATAAGISGINEPAAGTDSFFHNSVYIGGSPTAGTGSSWAFNSTQTTNTRSFRDNIFFNARSNSGATGKNYAVRVGGTTPNPAGLTINNNLYFANGTGAVFGFFNALDVANLGAWKTAVGQDTNSFESNPQYNDPTNAVPDLHLHPTNPTVAEGNGSDVGVVNDFDGQVRASFTPVDIGADAGNYNGIDLAPPSISYSAFLNTSSTANRILSVTLTDVTGVATGGNAPRIYFNKNAGSYFSTACSLASGSTTNGIWNCTIDNSLVGGVVATDIIRYFVVAQDTLGNLAANPGGGFSGTDVNTVITPPTAPNQYMIVGTLSGSLNVGTGETYTSLTNAGGLFEAINNSEVTGNITVNITTDLTGELGTVALNEFAPGFTVLLKPSGAPRLITGSNTGALIRLNAADNVRIDGSTTATIAADDNTPDVVGGNSALRQLTIQNTNVGTSVVVISIGSNLTNGAQNNVLKNTIIMGQDPTTSLAAVSIGGATPGTAATGPNNGNRVENCMIQRTIYGIFSSGFAATPSTGTIIRRNESSAVTGDRIRRVGIVAFNENGIQITENSLNGINTNESADSLGIGIGIQGVDNTITTSGGVTNANVSRNRINGSASLSTTGFSAVGIAVAGGTGGANTIANNMITGVTAPATSPDLVAGIFVAGVTGSSTKLYHNSIANTGNRGAVASQVGSFGVAITGSDPTVELKSNIFYTTQVATGGGTDAKSFAIGMVSTTFVNLDSNNNDFWSTGANDAGFRTGGLGAAGTDLATLAAWQTATTKDAASQEVDPTFVDPLTDLHLIAGSPVLGQGATVASVPADFDNDLRDNATDTGADEIPLSGRTGAIPAGTYRDGYAGAATLSGNVNFTGSLNLTGTITTGGNILGLTCTGAVGGATSSNYVIGSLRKDFCSTQTFNFPVGTVINGSARVSDDEKGETTEGSIGEYSPATVTINAGTVFPSSLTISVVDTWLPGLGQTSSTSRYWNVTETGDVNADMTMQYLNEDVYGNEAAYKVFKWNGVSTVPYLPSSVNAGANTFTATGVTTFSGWAAGVLVPTAASADISGRVLTADGRPIANVRVILSGGGLPESIEMYTGQFGYYSFNDLPVGQNYVVTVKSRRFHFTDPSHIFTLEDDIIGSDFVAEPQQ